VIATRTTVPISPPNADAGIPRSGACRPTPRSSTSHIYAQHGAVPAGLSRRSPLGMPGAMTTDTNGRTARPSSSPPAPKPRSQAYFSLVTGTSVDRRWGSCFRDANQCQYPSPHSSDQKPSRRDHTRPAMAASAGRRKIVHVRAVPGGRPAVQGHPVQPAGRWTCRALRTAWCAICLS